MTKQTELSWLPLSERKGITLPTIKYEEYAGQNYGGYYIHGSTELVVVLHTERNIPAVIAHEYRHYTQYFSGVIFPVNGTDFNAGDNYNLAIRKYYRSEYTEMDALLFEYKVAPNHVNKFWLKGLVLPERFYSRLTE